MRRDQFVIYEDALTCKRDGTALDVWFEHITIQIIDQEHVQLGRERLICEVLSVLGGNAIPALVMADGSDLEELLGEALGFMGVIHRKQHRSRSHWGRGQNLGDRWSRHVEHDAIHGACGMTFFHHGRHTYFIWDE
jgi:hypothetical protein